MLRLYRIEHGGAARYVAERAGTWRLVEGDAFGSFTEGAEVDKDAATLLAPVSPSKIVCVGLNYKDHALEQNKPLPPEPLLFIKPSTAVIGPGQAIEAPAWAGRVDHEAELGVVIGKECRNISRAQALEYVAGYSIALDMTVRGSEDRSFRKSPDTYSVLGPWLVTRDDITDPGVLDLWLTVNGQHRQRTNTSMLIYDVPRLIEYASMFYTLLPGDIIMTGTPEGVGPVVPGDVIDVGIQSIGTMQVNVVLRS
jgi:2,4-diketo-3-deoxy-L-fuconate hydrolase